MLKVPTEARGGVVMLAAAILYAARFSRNMPIGGAEGRDDACSTVIDEAERLLQIGEKRKLIKFEDEKR